MGDGGTVHDIQAIQQSIDKLAEALQEFHSNIAPLCSDNTTAQRELGLLIVAGTLVSLLWLAGIIIILATLHNISPVYQQRVIFFGTVAANSCLTFILFAAPEVGWFQGLVFTSWISWVGSMVGTVTGDITRLEKEHDKGGKRREGEAKP